MLCFFFFFFFFHRFFFRSSNLFDRTMLSTCTYTLEKCSTTHLKHWLKPQFKKTDYFQSFLVFFRKFVCFYKELWRFLSIRLYRRIPTIFVCVRCTTVSFGQSVLTKWHQCVVLHRISVLKQWNTKGLTVFTSGCDGLMTTSNTNAIAKGMLRFLCTNTLRDVCAHSNWLVRNI